MLNLKIAINLFYSPTALLKDILQRNKDLYVSINGGSGLRNDVWAKDNILFDDVGDNISAKNVLLNEMTSIYWIWKHYSEIGNPDYIGFNHYRRFFKRQDILDYDKYDCIVSKPVFSSNVISLALQYYMYHNIDDLRICIDTLKEVDPDFADKFTTYVLTTGINFAPCNMFIMHKDNFSKWCSFIFKTLSLLEPRIDLSNRDNYQRRALCFLTERLFGFWIRTNMKDIKQVDVEEHLDFKPANVNERGDYS